MNFKEIIKEEWKKEYPLVEGQEPYNFEDSLFSIYYELVERICVRVHNNAIELAIENVYVCSGGQDSWLDTEDALKLKINETEV